MSKWEKRKLGGLTNIKTGKLDVNAGNENGIYPFFTCAKDPYKIFSYSYDCECVLVAGNGDLNVKYYNGKFDAYQRTYIIESKDKSKLFVPYMFHFLNRYVNILRSQAIGGVIKYIKIGNLTEAFISLPPIETQQQIAKTLDTASELLAMRKQQLVELDNLTKSIFYDMFGDPVINEKGWDSYTGSEYSELLAVGVVVKPASYYVENGVIALRSLNVKPNFIDLSNLVYFSEECHRGVLSKSTLYHEDIVVVRTGMTGTAAVIPKELNDINCIDLIIIRPKKLVINPYYLSFLLNSEWGKSLVASKEVGGIQKHFNIGAIKELLLPIPPISIQNEFFILFNKIEAQKSLVKKTIEETQLLFDSLMSQYFD